MWTTKKEANDNALRNMMEYSYDGRDYRTATEEIGMYYHATTGSYIHPVHYSRVPPPGILNKTLR